MIKKNSNAKILISLLVLILVIVGLGTYYFYQARAADKNPNQEIARVTAAVGKLMVLPVGETPSLATVTNKANLQSQSFFANAANGDKLLIYAKEMKAILYRPSTNKIIEVAPIAQSNGSASTSTQSAVTQKSLKVAYDNGTDTAGLTASVEQKIQATFGGLTQTFGESDAAQKNYQDTLVVDLTGNNSTSTSVLAAFLRGKVGPLPAGEVAPQGADVLIILGKNIATAISTLSQKLLKIAYYNGTETAGVAAAAEQKIQAKFGDLTETVSKGDAIKKDYQGDLVVDLTGKNATSTQVIAAFLGGKVGSLPTGENTPAGADVLIILGK